MKNDRSFCQTAEELLEIYHSISAAFGDYSGDELVRTALVRAGERYVEHTKVHGCRTGEPTVRVEISSPLKLPACEGWLTVTIR
jgi:hypothetical protein